MLVVRISEKRLIQGVLNLMGSEEDAKGIHVLELVEVWRRSDVRRRVSQRVGGCRKSMLKVWIGCYLLHVRILTHNCH